MVAGVRAFISGETGIIAFLSRRRRLQPNIRFDSWSWLSPHRAQTSGAYPRRAGIEGPDSANSHSQSGSTGRMGLRGGGRVLRQSPITRAMGKKLEEVAGRPNRCSINWRIYAPTRWRAMPVFRSGKQPRARVAHRAMPRSTISGSGSLTLTGHSQGASEMSEIKCVHSRPVENAVANVKQVARLNRIELALRVLRTATLF